MYNRIRKNIIKHIRYKQNEQQYFEMDIETDTGVWRVVEP